MATDRPKFGELYKTYLAAVNEGNLEKTLSFLSPSVTCYQNGKLTISNRDATIVEYERHWAEMTQPVLLEDEPKELEDDYGVEVHLVDNDHRYKSTVRYIYAQEDGKWLHIRIEIIALEKF